MEKKTNKQENRPVHTSRKKSGKRRIALWIVLGALCLALIGGGIFVWHVLKRPEAFFDSSVRVSAVTTPQVTPAFSVIEYLPTAEPDATPLPTPVPSAEPEVTEQPDDGQLKGIVNVALFGIDAFENGRTSSGTMPHTDANLVLAINFDTMEVSLISIARDCLTTAPGYTGFYKFNGIFNVGGGMQNPKAGFELSCRAAEEWLGGVSIPYYYGVDFQALIDLVDMIGGIDFDVDISLTTMDGRKISPGKRHLDGQGVMAYVRMRKSADGLDSSRTARQRKMLVAIFKKLKREGKLSMIPDLLKTMGDNLYTNTTLAQTAALANFATGIDADSIQTYSIEGYMKCNYEWRYCFIDQQKRIEIIKSVYGIEVGPMPIDTPVYERFLHKSGFRAILYLNISKKLFAAVNGTSDSSSWSEEQKTAYAVCWQDYENLQSMFQTVDRWTKEHYDESVELTDAEEQERDAYYATLLELEERLKKSANALNELFGKPYRPRWNQSIADWSEKGSDINEIYVNFA